MMFSYKQLGHFAIHATDGDIGGCKDVLFDDQDFVVRYLVADTNTWLPLSRKVVLSPISISNLSKADKKVHVAMTRQELKDSPSIEEHKPVSREYEETLFTYFGYGYYWIGPGAWGDFAHPTELAEVEMMREREAQQPKKTENHLRSCSEVHGYDVATSDDDVGHITDFLIDGQSWAIKLLVVDTHNWLPGGKKLLLLPSEVKHIDWSTHKLHVKLSHDQLLDKPEIDMERLDDDNYLQELTARVLKATSAQGNGGGYV